MGTNTQTVREGRRVKNKVVENQDQVDQAVGKMCKDGKDHEART